MPVRTVTGKTTIKTQREHGQSEALLKMFHMALPWLAWFGLTIAGNLMLALFRHSRGWAALASLACALLVAWFDKRLRAHRASWEGRWIGPVTAAGAGLFTFTYLLAGFSVNLLLAYSVAGALACICWDVWITVGDHRDLAATFNRTAEAAGIGGARMVGVRRRPVGEPADAPPPGPGRAPRRGPGSRFARDDVPEVIEAGLVLPADPAMTADEVGEHLRHAEVAVRAEPGSFAITSDRGDAGLAQVRITPPQLLTAAPLPWPGPSAPGADMSVPFRLALLQDGRYFRFRRLPVHHLRVTGMTGSGKTMSLCWNMIAEGITREGYAAFAADPAKGEQFLGALRPALHALALTDFEVQLLFWRWHKARIDRCNFLGRNHHTEWFPGCGLVFMENWLEEAAAVLKRLGTTQADRKDGLFMLGDWVEDVNTSRSAGMAWGCSFQRPDKTQVFSTVARGQMGHVCFGVGEKDDLGFGLSDLQRERGCRPTLFTGQEHKGMAFADTETVPEDEKVTPMRFFHWGPGSARIASYASEWPARDRRLDDVTGEAMCWTPPRQPTAAVLPVPGPEHGNGGRSGRSHPGHQADRVASMLEARAKLQQVIRQWKKDGRALFTVDDLTRMASFVGRQRTWFYGELTALEGDRLIELADEKPKKRWHIIGVPMPRGEEKP